VENIKQFSGNIPPLSAVKGFWKSVEIWESYCQTFGGFLFGTRCIYIISIHILYYGTYL